MKLFDFLENLHWSQNVRISFWDVNDKYEPEIIYCFKGMVSDVPYCLRNTILVSPKTIDKDGCDCGVVSSTIIDNQDYIDIWILDGEDCE